MIYFTIIGNCKINYFTLSKEIVVMTNFLSFNVSRRDIYDGRKENI